MTKTQAAAIVSDIARANLAGWLSQAIKAGQFYYNTEKINAARDKRWMTIAVAMDGINGPRLDFYWPSPVPQYTTDDAGDAARVLLGHSEAVKTAAKAVGFDMKTRTFIVGGGGMDLAYSLISSLADKAGMHETAVSSLTRTSLCRMEGRE